jgi:ectoine hydroxylase-related dioxygenase (phytanoyl-CoA dioxygenase family)
VVGGLHADQFYVPLPWPETPLAMNVAWMATDFTEENGATLVVPGSHRFPPPAVRGPRVRHGDALPLEAPAGTAAVIDGRLWHQTGENRTDDERRIGLFAYYVKPWLRAQEVWPASLDSEVRRAATPVLRELVGDVLFSSLGAVNGQPLDGPRF